MTALVNIHFLISKINDVANNDRIVNIHIISKITYMEGIYNGMINDIIMDMEYNIDRGRLTIETISNSCGQHNPKFLSINKKFITNFITTRILPVINDNIDDMENITNFSLNFNVIQKKYIQGTINDTFPVKDYITMEKCVRNIDIPDNLPYLIGKLNICGSKTDNNNVIVVDVDIKCSGVGQKSITNIENVGKHINISTSITYNNMNRVKEDMIENKSNCSDYFYEDIVNDIINMMDDINEKIIGDDIRTFNLDLNIKYPLKSSIKLIYNDDDIFIPIPNMI